VLSLGVAACGSGRHRYDATAENNGYYIKAGAVTYQLQVSRELNPFAVEDRQYLTGLPAGTSSPTANELWYGVFLWAKNQTNHEQQTADTFTIVDSNGDRFSPIKLDPAVNGYAWTQQTLGPSGIEPGPNTTASFGPTQGGLLLFKLPTTVYSNRPLTLQIFAPGGARGAISLDL
jgi:hypothetical protein